MTATKEEEFKQHLAGVLADLDRDGTRDGEAMFLLGAAATRMCDMGRKPTWSALKLVLSQADYNRLLGEFQTEGNRMLAAGKHKQAYAVQALATSLVARTQADPVVREGEKLLDALIDRTVANFRKRAEPHLRKKTN